MQVTLSIVAEVSGVVVAPNHIEVHASGHRSPAGCSTLVPRVSTSEVQVELPTRKERRTMLVLGRKVHESIIMSDNIRITVLRVNGNRVRLGVEAPENVKVVRDELLRPGGADPKVSKPPNPPSPDGRRTDGEPLPGR
jgi:carbon storage regulator